MLRIETHATSLGAEISRQAYIAALRLTDKLTALVHGQAVTPAPEEAVIVYCEGTAWVVALVDPSIPDEGVEVRSDDERDIDCGD